MLGEILDLLTDFHWHTSQSRQKDKDPGFKFIAAVLGIGSPIFLVGEWHFIVKLNSPGLFLLIFCIVGILLAVLLTFLLLVGRILTDLNWTIVALMLFIGITLSVATGNYANRKGAGNFDHADKIEYRWFEYSD